MRFNFESVSNIVYFVTALDPPADWKFIHQQLSQLKWDIKLSTPNQTQWAVYTCDTNTIEPGSVLDLFGERFKGREFKKHMLGFLSFNEIFREQVKYMDRTELDAATEITTSWIATPPRYRNHPWHLDPMNQLAFGMIYCTQYDNPLASTYFDTGTPKYLLRVPSGPGQGWVVVNCDQARHCGMNDTDQFRYSFKFSLNLKQ